MAEENKSETVSGSIDTKLLINVYGSPATGKSFTAQNITAILHENGIDCEYIAEYATELIQQGRTDELKDQITVTGEQRRREVEAFKRTNLVITDSPTALGMLYSPKEQKAEVVKFGEQSDKTPHINILLRHNAESLATFSMNGRIHGKEESLRIQSEIVAMLQGKECLHFERGMSIEKLINDIRSTQQWQHFARSQSVEEKERTLRIAKCLQGEPVCVINDRQAPHKGMKSAKDWANAIFDEWGNKVISPELGEIVVNVHSVNDTFAHGLSPFKIEAIRSIKDVVEQGVVFAQTRVEDRNHYFIAAPIILENQVDIVSVLVHKDMNTQRMYLHSVMVREKILEKNFEQKNTPEHLVRSADNRGLSEPNRKLYSGDISRILQNYLKVNIRELEVEINQQIEQQKGNKMAQANDNTTEQQISRQELDNRLLSWSSQYIDALNNVIVAEQNSATLDERTNLVNAFYENKKQNPLLVAPDDILTATEKELKNEHLYGVQTIFSNTMDKLVEQVQQQLQQKTVATYSQDNPYAAYAKDNEEVRQNADDWEMREPLTSEKLLHFNELAQKQGFTTYVENHHADTGVFQADKEIDETYRIEITGQFKNHGSQDAFESARDFTMTFHQGDETVHYFYTNQLDKALEQAAEFSKNPAQWIENKDKTVEQHLSEMVDEVVAIANRHNQEQSQVESVSGNLKDEVKAIHQELAAQSLEFQFTHKDLADRTAAFNQELLKLTPEQLKELQPYFEQHKAIQTLQDLYKQTGDNARLDEINEHNRLIEWKIHNKVEAYLGKHIDYSDMDYYKGIKTGEELRQMMNRQPENTEKQAEVNAGKNFVQNFIENQLNAQNLQEVETISNISDAKTFQEKVMFARVEETEISKMIDDIAKQRLYLAVDFDNKDAAKAAGAKWDKALKGWYVEKGNLNDKLQAFLPQQPVTTVENRKPYSDLMAEAQKIGVELNSVNFKEDFHGWVRCPVKGKGKSNRDGGYKLFRNDDGSIGATVKNYSSGDSVNWCDKTLGDREVKSKVPLPDFIANKKQEEWNEVAKNTVEHNIQQMRSKIAEQAYHSLQPALSTDPYIQKKGIVDIGKLRRLDDGSTIVPLFHNGKIANLQMIRASDNEKRMMTQAVKVGAYYSIGNGKNPQTVIIAEGMATADSVHQIASEIYGKDKVLTLAAIDSGNLKAVADKVDKVYPDAQKLIAADNDLGNELKAQQRGVDSAETHKYNAGFKYANQVIEVYPHFKAIPAPAFDGKNTDWNDVLTTKGFDTSIKLFQERIDRQPANVKQQAATPQMTPQRKNGTDGRER
ncbi:MAG: hypothetical protein J6M43_08905 [Neisseriaceae bacterium]|nr:hypothetical protein [Neisseriaceae bacterium]